MGLSKLLRVCERTSLQTRSINIYLPLWKKHHLTCYHPDKIKEQKKQIPIERIPRYEYTDVAQYPQIEDLSIPDVTVQKRKWYAKITALPTVEQKLIELNFPKYYGFNSIFLNDVSPSYNDYKFLPYATRTHVVRSLPTSYYDDVKEEVEKIFPNVKKSIKRITEDGLYLKADKYENMSEVKADTKIGEVYLGMLHNQILKHVTAQCPSYISSYTHVNPRIEGFWFIEPLEDKKYKAIRSCSSPYINLRVNAPLPDVEPMEESDNYRQHVPDYAAIDPSYVKEKTRRAAVILPGFWPTPFQEHSQLFLHHRANISQTITENNGVFETDNYVLYKMLISCFTQALSHATWLGFGPTTELTYPLVQQSIVTDSRNWHFATYQMNTCALQNNNTLADNPRTNVLWLSEAMELYHSSEDGKVKGFNDEVIKNIIAMYLKKGEERINPHPYLAPWRFLSEHGAKPEYRQEFLEFLQNLYACRKSRYQRMPEAYAWEKIYRIWFKPGIPANKRRFYNDLSGTSYPGETPLDFTTGDYIPRPKRIHRKIRNKPKIHSEKLFHYSGKYLDRDNFLEIDDGED